MVELGPLGPVCPLCGSSPHDGPCYGIKDSPAWDTVPRSALSVANHNLAALRADLARVTAENENLRHTLALIHGLMNGNDGCKELSRAECERICEDIRAALAQHTEGGE